MMLTRRTAMLGLAACGLPFSAQAQGFPSRSITIVVPYPPGGPIDALARLIAQEATIDLKQSVVVENRPGASGVVGANAVARADPDGHMLVLGTTRVGKTRLAELLIAQDIRRGEVVIVVDADVDVHDYAQVAFYAGANVDPARDVVLSDGPADQLDHSTVRQFTSGKLGIDATAKWPDEGAREWPPEIAMSGDVRALVDRRWPSYGIDL